MWFLYDGGPDDGTRVISWKVLQVGNRTDLVPDFLNRKSRKGKDPESKS